jgi:large conductance mechanosensitive channel
MLTGFKNFIMKGNVVDLAVAVVMGAAFGAVVTSIVEQLLTPSDRACLPGEGH